jgi:hypothetical protein
MPIVSNSVESSTQADGSLSVVVRLFDQDAREYMSSFFAPPGFNVDAKVAAMTAQMDEQLAEDEFRQIVGL